MRSIKSAMLFGAVSACVLVSGALGVCRDPRSGGWSSIAFADGLARLEPGLLAVVLKQSGQLALVDSSSGAVRRLVDLWRAGEEGGAVVGPHEVALSDDGRTAVVGLYGSALAPGDELVFVSLPEGVVTGRMELEGFSRPHGLAFVGEGAGERLLVTVEAERSLLVIDPLAREVERSIETLQWGSHMVAAGGGVSGRAYVANVGSASVSVIDLSTGTLDRVVSTGPGAEGIAVRPGSGDGAGEVWVANNASHTVTVIDGETLETLATLLCSSIPIRVAFTPDGSRALVTSVGTGELVVYDASAREEIGRVGLLSEEHYGGEHPQFGTSPVPVGMVVSPTGRFVYVSSIAGGYVSAVDLEAMAVVGVFDLGDGRGPDGIAFVGG